MSINLEQKTINNPNFRKVIQTTKNMQLVLMSLEPNEDIGMEMHKTTDQFIRVESGSGVAIFADSKGTTKHRYKLSDGFSIMIPKGTYHNIKNTGNDELKLYTIYSPPNHKDKLVQKNKPRNHHKSL